GELEERERAGVGAQSAPGDVEEAAVVTAGHAGRQAQTADVGGTVAQPLDHRQPARDGVPGEDGRRVGAAGREDVLVVGGTAAADRKADDARDPPDAGAAVLDQLDEGQQARGRVALEYRNGVIALARNVQG